MGYAKSVVGLQRVLDIFWMVHNFVRSHFTTREVPAVALGIIQKGLTWEAVILNLGFHDIKSLITRGLYNS